jgi:HEPN domain-containing protein
MPPRDQIPGTPQDWLKRAKSNLAIAKAEKPKEALWEDLCFDAQQTAEKSFKAVLLHKNIAFRYVHDIHELITSLMKNGIDVPPDIQQAAGLTEYAVKTRYPGIEPVSEEEYYEAVQLAEQVLAWAESIILS